METICAISTPQGIGGIAVIRVSGKDAVAIVDSIFSGKKTLKEASGYSAHYGKISDIDDVIVTLYRAPHSFTGEDIAEISCHGSLYIQQAILQQLLDSGCRMAEAGEFTQRAFLNGKMDLSEAEAVADLIASESKAAHDLALNHLRGGIKKEIGTLRDQLLTLTSLLELELDFADHEELEFADRTQLCGLSEEIHTKLHSLIASFKAGNALKNGISVAIIGPTNAGKSSLLNALVGEDRAIVSEKAGTTRDTIEDVIDINGTRFRFIDTAGIRHTEEEIESLGIERSRRAAQEADIIIAVRDGAVDNNTTEIEELKDKEVIYVANKSDKENFRARKGEICLSAKEGQIEPLIEQLKTYCTQADGVMVSNVRHYEALRRAYDAIERVIQGINNNLSGEFLAMDLHDCLNALGEITGEITNDEVLHNIFAHFCIGK